MKKNVFLLSCFCSLSLMADGKETVVNPVDNLSNHRISFSPHYSYDKYEGSVKSVRAHFVGINLGYEFLKPDSVYFGVSSHVHTASSSSKNKDAYYDISYHGHGSLKGGYTFSLKDGSLVSPYLTVGSHIWREDKNNSITVHYYGVGATSRFFNFEDVEFGLNPEVFLAKEENGTAVYGVKLELPIAYSPRPGFQVGITPVVKRFHCSTGHTLGCGLHLAKKF